MLAFNASFYTLHQKPTQRTKHAFFLLLGIDLKHRANDLHVHVAMEPLRRVLRAIITTIIKGASPLAGRIDESWNTTFDTSTHTPLNNISGFHSGFLSRGAQTRQFQS